jgi:two-component system NarL family response regulator
VGTAENGLEAQRLAQELRPDVIVMDIHMPICDGIEATRQIKQALPEIEIVMLTVSAEDQVLYEALKAGASGYLLKSMQAKEFFTLLTGLADGVPPFAPELAGKILDEFKTYLNPATNLSDQERSILGLVAQGKTYFQIGQELHVSDRTVRRYMKGIMERLHLRSRAEMERYARERGLGKP